MSKRKGIGDVAETGVEMTRAVPAASASAEEGRKRKVGWGRELSYSTSFVHLRSRQRRKMLKNSTENSADTCNSNDPSASCCSSNESSGLDSYTSESPDLEVEQEEEVERSVEIGTSTYEFENCCRDRRETTPSSEVQAPESVEPESTTALRLKPSMSSEANSSRRRRSTGQEKKMPSKAELEEFFTAAEKKLQQKFAQKYNFDVVKEEPLEGRYEWVRVKPGPMRL